MISIHAPLAGCDGYADGLDHACKISIHAPLAGCDTGIWYGIKDKVISIHAPLAGCDEFISFAKKGGKKFQSTHPLRGATRAKKTACTRLCISIHAPLAGCDVLETCLQSDRRNFNPRTPCGVRRCHGRRSPGTGRDFNPRTPCGVRLDVHFW